MAKSLSIIGMGMGVQMLTQEARQALQEAEVYFGAPRMIQMLPPSEKEAFPYYQTEKILAAMDVSQAERFAVLVSGDTGFYSAADTLSKAVHGYEIQIIPGISSLSYFFAKLKRPWQDVRLLSCHGRDTSLVDTVRRNFLTFALTGKNTQALSARLCNAGYEHLPIVVGEDLGTENEKITFTTAKGLLAQETSSLCVLLIENSAYQEQLRFGIPDEAFQRGSLPMTKSLVRSAILSRLNIRPDDVCYDIGAGTGSVSVEMALAAYRGAVYSIDTEQESGELIRENARRFHIGNIQEIWGEAPEALEDLPAPNVAFIGGSRGNMERIFRALIDKNPRVRIVVTAIALESLQEAKRCFLSRDILCDIEQLSVSKAKRVGGIHMMLAENPIYLLSGGGDE